MEKMTTTELDRLLTAMVKSAEGISDLLFVPGKPPQVEVHGQLETPAIE
jgi:Tfp pilus assembly ATPase PilU